MSPTFKNKFGKTAYSDSPTFVELIEVGSFMWRTRTLVSKGIPRGHCEQLN